MNLRKGFRRITILLSVLVFIGCFGIAGYAELGGDIPDNVPDILLHFDPIYFPRLFFVGTIGVACVWICYWLVCWIVMGFKEEKKAV